MSIKGPLESGYKKKLDELVLKIQWFPKLDVQIYSPV
jgi:hypothetical protein